ncbi:DUF4307 domain-containing protein [Tessaracoccus sp. Z1128]
MTSQDEARIAARYPQRSPVDFILGGLAGAAVLGAIILVIVTGVVRSSPPVAAMIRGFEVESPSKVTAELVIQREDPAVPVECQVYAQATSFEKVAEQLVEVPAGDAVLTDVHITLRTVKEATSVSIEGCRTVG